MKNSNIIISVIIVFCIAGGVTAYSMTNPDGNIFSLPGYTPSDDASTSGDLSTGDSSANDGTGDANTDGNTGSGSGAGNNGNGGDSNTASSGSAGISASKAKSIASGYIEEGTAGTPYKSSNQWIVPVIVNGKRAGAIYINAQTGANEGGEGGAP